MNVVSAEMIQTMKDNLADPDVPRRGGKEWLGVFIRRVPLDGNYELGIHAHTSYWQNTHQICRPKYMLTIG